MFYIHYSIVSMGSQPFLLNPDYAKMSEERIAVALNPTTYTKADIPDAAPLFAEEK